jgi:hypothetical protein
VVYGGRIGSRSVMAVFVADTRPVAEVPRSTCRHKAHNWPLDFWADELVKVSLPFEHAVVELVDGRTILEELAVQYS